MGASVAGVLGEENIVDLQSARDFNHHSENYVWFYYVIKWMLWDTLTERKCEYHKF